MPVVAAAVVLDPVHDPGNGYGCQNCHQFHESLGTTGYNNICLDCHRPGVPTGGVKPFVALDAADPFNVYTADLRGRRYQHSHRWDGAGTVPAAGAQSPELQPMTRLDLLGRINAFQACVSCHNPHANTAKPFLRMGNDRDQMCLDCHRSRNKQDHLDGTHPVNVVYSGAQSLHPVPVNANPANRTSAMKLIDGKVLCTTCHGIHYTDSASSTYDGYSSYYTLKPSDGYLLRTDLRGATANGVNICTNCHAGKTAHNGAAQNIQCADCHGAHVEYDPLAVTPQEKVANVFLIRRYMNISTQYGRVDNRNLSQKRTFFQATGAGRNYKRADGSGVCQSCHDVPPAGFDPATGKQYPPQHNDLSGNPQTCVVCHKHNNTAGSFSADLSQSCALCHGYPPTATGLGGPSGLSTPATGALGANPNQPGAHDRHVNFRAMGCQACHSGYTASPMGNGQIEIGFAINSQTMPGFAGTITSGSFTGTDALTGYAWRASTAGTTVATAPNAATCTVYCHGSTLTGGTNSTPSWTGGTPQAACGTCHGATASAPPATGNHLHHAGTLALACETCHPATPDNAHVNGTVSWSLATADPRFGANATYRGTVSGSTGVPAPSAGFGRCSVYCHGSTTPVWGSVNPTTDCTWCHGNNAQSTVPVSSGTHPAHINGAAIPGTPYACAQCHATTVSTGNDRLVTGTAHVNGVNDVALFLGGSWNPAAKSCANSYCHSNGQGGYVNPPAWNSTGTLGCNGCHGTGNPLGYPDNSTPNSHAKHVTAAADCGRCHRQTTITGTSIRPGSLNHTNQLAEVNLGRFSPFAPYSGIYDRTTKTCSATYCHGSSQTTPPWGGSTDCRSCHGANNDGNLSGATGASPGGHALHYNNATLPATLTDGDAHTATEYVYACRTCHPTTNHATGPVSAAITAEINGSRLTAAQYTAGGVSQNDLRGFAQTNGTCLTLCHSKDGITPGSANQPAVWNGARTANNCGVCHGKAGDPLPTWSAPHTVHVNTYGPNPNFGCNACHAGTAASNLAINGAPGRNQHPNGVTNVQFSPFAQGSWSSGQCGNTWCHSQGTSLASPLHGPLAWNPPSVMNCASCHSGGIGTGPTYANGSLKANSHAAHTTGTNCQTCHSTVINAANNLINLALHVNRQYDIAAGPGVTFAVTAGTGTPANPAQCTNISCHGANSAVWGGTLHCQDCHGGPADQDNFTGPFWNDGSIGMIRISGEWDTAGHGKAAGSYVSGNPAAAFTGARGCEYCHDPGAAHQNGSNPFRLKNYSTGSWGRNAPCLICHATNATGLTINGLFRKRTSSPAVDSYHFGVRHGGANGTGGRFCWDCHDPHGDANGAMIHAAVAQNSDPATGAPLVTRPTVFTAGSTGSDFAKSAAPFDGICNVCHIATRHYTATAGNSHYATTNCTDCHNHTGSNANRAFMPIGLCDSCHGYPPVRRGLLNGSVFFAGNYSSARYEDYSGGGGAHNIEKHVKAAARPAEGWVNCAGCHSKGNHNPVSHTMIVPVLPSGITINVDPRYKYDQTRELGPNRYSGTLTDDGSNRSGTCSNIKCHFKPAKKWSTEK